VEESLRYVVLSLLVICFFFEMDDLCS
jgi:hypothetical protein